MKDRHKILYWFWLIFADCGRTPWTWLLWSVIITSAFAGKFLHLGPDSFEYTASLGWDFSTTLYYSVVTFTTLGFGDVTPLTQCAAWCVMAEVILGYVMLGGLISFLASRIFRRS